MAKGKLEVEVMVNIVKRLEVELDEAGVLTIKFLHENGAITEKRVENFRAGDSATLTFGKP